VLRDGTSEAWLKSQFPAILRTYREIARRTEDFEAEKRRDIEVVLVWRP
jgi:hypothetical protein